MDKEFLKNLLLEGKSTREIGSLTGYHYKTVCYWIAKHDLKNFMVYKKNPNFNFEKIDTREKAYTLGFILADAGITNTKNVEVSVAIADKEVAEFIAQIINGNVQYDYTFDKKAKRFPRARITKRIKDITKFTGGEAKKDRHYPRVRSDLERYLLLGIFDADGCITWGRRKDKNRLWCKISFTSSFKILTGVQQFLLKELSISTALRPKSNKKDCYVLEFSNKADVLKFIDYLYPNEEFIILQRKYSKSCALRLELEEFGGTAN